jgi:hypothetical protein
MPRHLLDLVPLLGGLMALATTSMAFGQTAAIAGGTPPTLRVDYIHSGNALEQHFALERIVVEPLPWPGNPARPIDDSNPIDSSMSRRSRNGQRTSTSRR